MAPAHDEHFLTRLQRLDSEHAELALGLYFDHELVCNVLASASIPAGCERVALCLGKAGDGPHLIVARDGHFVTALAEGMVLRPDQVVISRARLDKISESVEALRTLFAEAESGAHRQTRRLLRQVYTMGPGMSQEEFDALARWLPLLDVRWVMAHIDLVSECHMIVERLARARRITGGHEKLLREYWRRTWAAAHLTMLLGSDGGERMRKIFDRLCNTDATAPTQMAWSMVRLGVTSFAERGAWSVSKMPGHVLPVAKRRYLSNFRVTPLVAMCDALSLAVIGLRHRRQRAMIGKTLRKRSGGLIDPDLNPSVIHTRELAASRYSAYEADPEPAFARSVAAAREEVGRRWPALTAGELSDLDDAHLLALSSTIPQAFVNEPEVMAGLFDRLPWIARVEARDFYLPEDRVELLRQPWTRADGLALFEARALGGIAPSPTVVRDSPKIGRNQPCPCGSGAKYKRCCGAPGGD